MARKATHVLLAAADPGTVAEITVFLATNLAADLTIVDTLKQAETLAAGEGFDLVLAASELSDGDGLDFLRRRSGAWGSTGQGSGTLPPVIIIDHRPDTERVLAAMRAGAADVFTRPFDARHMSAVVRRAIKRYAAQRKQETRNRRLRRLSSRLVRDRRELRGRIDLICRDVVLAYRRLVEKTITAAPPGSTGGPRSSYTSQPQRRIKSPNAKS